MLIRVRSIVVALALHLTVTIVSAADIGTAFTYQGYLESPPGAPVTDTCDFRIALWDDPLAGSERGNSPQTASAIPVSEGSFAIELDFGAGAMDGTARWLEVEVQCPGDSGFVLLSPRVELTPAPYALRASEGVGGPTALNVTTAQQVGIGTAAPAEKLHVAGNARVDGVLFGSVLDGSSPLELRTSGITRVHIKGGSNCCASRPTPGCDDPACQTTICLMDAFCCQVEWDGACVEQAQIWCFPSCVSGVGINTGSPTAALDVEGNAAISDTLRVSNETGGIALEVSGDAQFNHGLAVLNTLTAGGLGIGTTAPTAPAEVIGAYMQERGQIVVRHLPTTPAYGWWGAGTNSVVFGANNIAASGGIEFRLGTGATTSQVMLLQAEGRVAINRNGASHPLQVGTTSSNGNGAHVTAGGTWTNGSSREFKKEFTPIDERQVLEKLTDLPITQWQYESENGVRHIGPVAEDFRAAFGLGHDDRYITTIDADGVALAAIQGLHQIVQEKDCEIGELRSEIDQLKEMVRALAAQKEGSR